MISCNERSNFMMVVTPYLVDEKNNSDAGKSGKRLAKLMESKREIVFSAPGLQVL
jgi:hypothetical protein